MKREKLDKIQQQILFQRSPEHPKNKVSFWQRVSKVIITSTADPQLIKQLSKLISADVEYKEN